MFVYKHKVHYYETDRMGVTHHSNYIRIMEEARVAYLDAIGASVEYLYASLSSTAGRAFLIFKVREAEAAREALVKAGIELVEDLR